MVMRDIVVSNIIVVPFRYNPSIEQLEVFESIEIQIEEIGDREDIRVRDLSRSRVFENIYKNTIINSFKDIIGKSPDFAIELYGTGEARKQIAQGLLNYKI